MAAGGVVGPGTSVKDQADLYARRFGQQETRAKNAAWREVVQYLSRYFPPDARVLDLGCDAGGFIRHVSAKERWASDIRDVQASLPSDVRFVHADGLELATHLPHAYFDVIFMSNYLEHLASGEQVVRQLAVARTLLSSPGRVIILQPNIKLVGGAYWDFIDHRVALTDRSLVEAAELAGLRATTVVRRFLPYSTKGRLPVRAGLVRAYLAFPPAWWFLGKQTLFVGGHS